jgi:tetratricopeptide (TPR) repeat protein
MATATQPESPAGDDKQVDFFISRRGASAAVAQEVAQVLLDEHYTVIGQDFDFRPGQNFVALMDDALKRARHLIVLLTKDYGNSPYTQDLELFPWIAQQASPGRDQRIVLLRLDDVDPTGIIAGIIFVDLVGVSDPEERKKRILAAAEGRPIASPRRPKLFENVPQRDLNFTGRDQQLDELHAILMPPDKPADITRAAIHGLAGVGKSSLVAEYTYRHAADYAGVWWAPAERRKDLVESLAQLAAHLDSALARDGDQGKTARAALDRVSRGAIPFLLVYDNVETPEELRDLLPSSGARVLITTRWPDWSGRAAVVKLNVLPPAAAAEFLQKRASRSDLEGAGRLAKELGYLPVALDHAGAYCALDRSLSFDDYRERIQALIGHVPTGAPYPLSVAKTFGLAIEKAIATSASAERLLGFCAFLDPDGIPLDLIKRAVLGQDERSEALHALTAVSLIEFHEADGMQLVRVHRLVQAAMRARLTRQDQIEASTGLAVECLVHALKQWKTTVDVIIDPAGRLYRNQLWILLPYTGDMPSAEPLWRHAMESAHIYEAFTRKSSEKTAPTSALYGELLATVLERAGRYQEAEQQYRTVIAQIERALGPDDVSLARLHNAVGLFYLDRALDSGHTFDWIVERMGFDFIWGLIRLAFERDAYAKAAIHFQRALAIAEKTLAPDESRAILYRSHLHFATSPLYRFVDLFKTMAWPSIRNSRAEKAAAKNATYILAAVSFVLLFDAFLLVGMGKGLFFSSLKNPLSSSMWAALELALSAFGAWLAFRAWKEHLEVAVAWAGLVYFLAIYVLGFVLLGEFEFVLGIIVSIGGTSCMFNVVRAAYSAERRRATI